MELSDRKKMILQAVIDEYIGSAEPVGSRAISKKNELGLSSATIRNEMADLEEMGYLIQPHTSAGRIPSDAGYRFYVNSLMRRYKMGVETIEKLKEELAGRINSLDRTIMKAGYLAAALTDYTIVFTTPVSERADIKKIDLVSVAEDVVTLIIVTSSVKNKVIRVSLTEGECAGFAEILNVALKGKVAGEITDNLINQIEDECIKRLQINPQIITEILDCVCKCIDELGDSEVFIENAQSILNYPEYRDVGKAKAMFEFLDDKSNLKKLIARTGSGEVCATIGRENEPEILKDCSLVTVDYSLDGKSFGKMGVIGPKRMNYSQVFASLDLISNEINKLVGYIKDDGDK